MATFNITNKPKDNWSSLDSQLTQMMFTIAMDTRMSVPDFINVLNVIDEDEHKHLHKFLNSYLEKKSMLPTEFEKLVREFVQAVRPHTFIEEARGILIELVDCNYPQIIMNNIFALFTVILDSYGHGHLVGLNSKEGTVIFDNQPTSTTFVAMYVNESNNVKGSKSVLTKGLFYKREQIRANRNYVESYDFIGLPPDAKTIVLKTINQRDIKVQVEMISTVALVNAALNISAMFFEFTEEDLHSPLANHSLLATNQRALTVVADRDKPEKDLLATNHVMASLAHLALNRRNVIPPRDGMVLHPPTNSLGISAVYYSETHVGIHDRVTGVVEVIDGRRIPFNVDIMDIGSLTYQLLTPEQLHAVQLILAYNGVTANEGIESSGYKFKSRLKKLDERERFIADSIFTLTTMPYCGEDFDILFKPLNESQAPLYVVKGKYMHVNHSELEVEFISEKEVLVNPLVSPVKKDKKVKQKPKKGGKKVV